MNKYEELERSEHTFYDLLNALENLYQEDIPIAIKIKKDIDKLWEDELIFKIEKLINNEQNTSNLKIMSNNVNHKINFSSINDKSEFLNIVKVSTKIYLQIIKLKDEEIKELKSNNIPYNLKEIGNIVEDIL